MTDVSSRPMATPDLANLLKRPRRPGAQATGETTGFSEGTALSDNATDETKQEAPRATTAEEPAPVPSGSGESVPERKQRRPKPAADVVASTESSQTPGRQYLRIKII